MTNREVCLEKIAELADTTLCDIVENYFPAQSEDGPVYQSICDWCQQISGGECPAGEEGCDVDVSAWMDAEAVPK